MNSQYRFSRADLLEWAALQQRPFSPEMLQEIGGEQPSEVSLAESVTRGGVAVRVEGADRYEVFRAAIRDLTMPSGIDRETLLDLLMAREKASGTAIGDGIAIPHPRYPVVLTGNVSIVRVCYLTHPLDYQAADGKLVDTLFLMICPTVHEHLQLLARLASVLHSPDFRSLLATRPDKTRLVSAIRAAEQAFSERMEAIPK